MSAGRTWRGPLLMVIGLLVGWQALYAAVGDIALRSPADTIRYTVTLLGKETFWPHLWESMRAFAVAIVIAVAAGVGIGLALGFGRMAGQVFEPMLVALYSVPKVTLYPILLLTFGLGISAKIAFGALHGFIPIALFTINAVRNVRPILVKTGRVLNYGTGDMVWRILIPAALPEIFSGIRIGVSLTLIGTLLGEMFASQRGLGYMLMNGIGLHNVDVIMAITFILIVFAATVSSALLAVDRRLHRRV
ncbi:MAG: ABC transporter permease subunit [Alphaproteobacteria bacterium]|nr:ABC transporter permease subunit [Alphaproteobacteria bacterium]